MQIERAKSQPDQQLQGAIGHRAAAEEPSGRIQAETQRMDRRMGVEQHQIRSSRSVLANCSGCARGRYARWCTSSKTAMRQRMSSGENSCAIPRSTSGVTNSSRSCASIVRPGRGGATRSRRPTSRNRRNAGADGCAAARSNRSRPSPRAGPVRVADIGHRRTAQDQVGDIARGTPDAGEGGLDGRDAPTHGATRQPSWPSRSMRNSGHSTWLWRSAREWVQRYRLRRILATARLASRRCAMDRDCPAAGDAEVFTGRPAIAARPAQDMRIRHGTRSSLDGGRRLAGESETLYAGSGDMSRTRGLRFGKGIRATRARLVHSEYTAFPQATHRLAHRDMHRQSPPLVRGQNPASHRLAGFGECDRMTFRTEYRRPCPPGWRRCWPGRPAERDAAAAPGAGGARRAAGAGLRRSRHRRRSCRRRLRRPSRPPSICIWSATISVL